MSEVKVNKISPRSGTDVTLGDSSDTFTVPSGATLDIASGATLTNNGTATGFPEYDDSVVQSNIAMLGFKVAVNGSLTRYNLVDQSIDEFFDTSGVDASASTNEYRVASGANYYYWGASGTQPSGGDSTDTSVEGFTTQVFSASTGSLVIPGSGNVTILVVGGGASGGNYYAGGGGAGGLVYKAVHAVTANTYDAVIGAGGAANTSYQTVGNSGADTTWTINGGAQEFIAKGGGGGGYESADNAVDGGSGGGQGYGAHTGGASTQSAQSGESGSLGFGNAGGSGEGATGSYNTGGGGGAGAVGANGTADSSGNGGDGKDYSAIFGTALGDSGWFAGGGGGGITDNGTRQQGIGGAGGGSNGATMTSDSSAADANTGGGAGGGGTAVSYRDSGAGGSGVILVRYADDEFLDIDDLTLQSTDATALTAPTYGEFVTLIENAYGTATLNTDIKGYISRDSGTTFTQGTLVDEGSWGTNKKILGFHDLDISAQPSGTSMCYKITTHNQAVSSKETRIYATSIGWR